MALKKKSYKIGIYCRVSTDEQAQVVEGSLSSQKSRIESYIGYRNEQDRNWGRVVACYVDDGYSAKDTNRPEYQKMMRDVRQGRIDLIVAADLSRLSRSISDFCALLQELEECRAKFLSVKEQFDTSTAAGELNMFNMINFAQFERKQTSERVSQNFNERAKKGLKSGGAYPLGYKPNPDNPGVPAMDEEEAVWVRRAFEIYLETGSTRVTVERLNELPHPRGCSKESGRFWTYDTLKTMLRNRGYIGEREVNAKYKNEDPSFLKPWQRYEIKKAAWAPIVDGKTFNAVQVLLDDAQKLHRQRTAKASARIFLLSGVIRCGECGRALIGQSAGGAQRVHRYYSHKDSGSGERTSCSVVRYNADEVEKVILEHLADDAIEAGYLEDVATALKANGGLTNAGLSKAIDRVEQEIAATDRELENLMKFEVAAALTSGTSKVLAERMETLSLQKRTLSETLADLMDKEKRAVDAGKSIQDIEARILEFKRKSRHGNPMVLKRLLRGLYDVIYIAEGRLQGFYRPVRTSRSFDPRPGNQVASGNSPEATSSILKKLGIDLPLAGWQESGLKVAYWGNWWT